jgi:hypothetical protein
MYNPYQQYFPQQQQPTNSVIWVQGDAGAKSYMVGAGNSVVLMDSESEVFYIKSADQAGMPSLRKFKYEELTGTKEPANGGEYVTRAEFEKRLSELKGAKE